MNPITFYCPTKNHSQYKGYALEEVLTPLDTPIDATRQEKPNAEALIFQGGFFWIIEILCIFVHAIRIIQSDMVDVAQLVEPWIVVPVVAGSIPVVHPK